MEIIKIIDKPIQQRTFLYEFQIENEDTDYFIQKIENVYVITMGFHNMLILTTKKKKNEVTFY